MERRIDYLIENKIVFRRLPITDVPNETHDWGWYYKDGTHQCYTLFNSKAKINTFKSLKWHLLVLWYLNPQLDPDAFYALAEVICNKRNGFVTFSVNTATIDRIVYEINMHDLEDPPNNKVRKIIFKPWLSIDIDEKLKIVGRYVGRSKKIDSGDIYQCMIDLHDADRKITLKRVSDALNVSTRTVHRHMCDELKREKMLLNKEL